MARKGDNYDLGVDEPTDPGQPTEDPMFKAVSDMYRSALGRDPENSDVVNNWISGSGRDILKVQQGIYGSPEAKARNDRLAAKDAAPQTPAAPPPTDTSGQPVASNVGPPAPAPTAAAGATQAGPVANSYSGLEQYLQSLLANQQAQSADNNKYKSNLRSTVQGLIDSSGKPVSENDPTILGQVRAFRGEGQRALRLQQEALAERAHAGGMGGLSAGSVDAGVKQGYNRLGQATGGYRAGLMGQRVAAQQQQLMQALQLGAGELSGDESRMLQERLGVIGSQLQSYGQQAQTGLGYAGLANARDIAGINAGPGYAGVGAQTRGQDLQNQQFYDRLAFDQGKENSSLDSLLMQYLLAGG